MRCAECTTITKRNGTPGFRFRWHKNSQCGIVSGCPYLGGVAGGQQTLTLPVGGLG